MAIVYVLEQGVTLTKRHDQIIIKNGKQEIRSYPEMDVEKIVIFGKANITPHLIDFLLKKNIELIFVSKSGKYRGRLVGEFSKNVSLRITQTESLKDKEFCIDISKKVVYGKIRNGLALLQRINWEHRIEAFKTLIKDMRKYAELSMLQSDIESLRGIEGTAANTYYSILRYFVKNDTFYFHSRNRRPPEDPANAILSFLYTMLYHFVESAIYIVGLDPFLGFFHTIDYGKPSLALDLMEEFRPIMDRIFLRLVNKNMLKLGDFYFVDYPEKKVQAVYLATDGRKKVVSEFQQEIDREYFFGKYKKTYVLRNIIIEQARLMASAIKKEKEYQPFKLQL